MQNWKKKWLYTPEGLAVLSAMVMGIVTHLFGLVNALHNYDDIATQPSGYGTGVTSGRWFLEILGGILEKLGLHYNLPVVNGLLFLVFVALAAGFLVSFFRLKKKISGIFVGMLFVVFPTAASTLFFRFTAPYYGFAVLMSVLAAWVLRRCRWGLLLSGFLTAASLGIYQAYVPITIAMFVLQLIQESLEGETDAWTLVKRGLYDCAALLLGVVLYFLFLQLCLKLYRVELTDYQGISTMGQLSLGDLPKLVWQAFESFCKMPFYDYYGLASRKIVKLTYLLLAAITMVMVILTLMLKIKKTSLIVLTCLLCLVFPVAVNFMVIMCNGGWLYTLMIYGFVLVPCAPLVLWEQMPSLKMGRELLAKPLAFATALLIFCYAYYTNVNYSALYFANRQVENYVSSITVQVRMTEGFDADKQWAFLGEIEDPLLSCPWEGEDSFGGSGFTEYLLNQYSLGNWFQNYVGYRLPLVSTEKAAQLHQTEEVAAMSCWPAQGSIRVIGDTVVVKFQEYVTE